MQDLDAYIANFSGQGKIDRLMFVARHAPALAIDAYTMAEKAIKATTINTKLYGDVVAALANAWCVARHVRVYVVPVVCVSIFKNSLTLSNSSHTCIRARHVRIYVVPVNTT